MTTNAELYNELQRQLRRARYERDDARRNEQRANDRLAQMRKAMNDKFDLANADTRSLLAEVALRMEYLQNSIGGTDLGRMCFEAIENLDGYILDARRLRDWRDDETQRFARYLNLDRTT